MSTETVAILRAIVHQIDDTITAAKKTIDPKVLSYEESQDWRAKNRRTYEGPQEADDKRRVTKHWPELEPLAELLARVQQYIVDVSGPPK